MNLVVFTKYIRSNRVSLANDIVDSVIERMELDIPKWEKDQAVAMYIDLFGFLAESIDEELNEVPNSLIEWSKKNAEMQVTAEGRISEIVRRYPPTREVFSDLITGISLELDLSLKDHTNILKKINSILDVSLTETCITYECLMEKFKKDKFEEILKLSAPIVPVKENIVIIPLIGKIDERCTEHIIENVIPKVANMRTKHVIADYSGALTIDSYSAEALHRIGGVFRLMGINVVSAGLRKDIVMNAIDSKIDFGGIKAYANVKQALENIN
ncbi:STAS domain-containing protein [Bacillus sp. FJAT-45037]|uniref:STAS domain-containing protein n=1 Tax=Bacillus sp. FJAT-45037 TaxID=2011007 RepID=UPI000C25028A|nr:STAS domain-containing protein [Bacillus sp. FJAT-45037]